VPKKRLAAIHETAPAFSIHIGDTKGYGDCGRPFQEGQRAFFDTYAQPVVYTPGNNEWADCWKANRGSADPLAILAIMRDVFWSEPVLRAILDGADAFDGMVLVVQGHDHELTVDRPASKLDFDKPGVSHPNVLRLQVYGWPDMKAVQVHVDTGKPWVFGFEPLYAPGQSVSSHPGR